MKFSLLPLLRLSLPVLLFSVASQTQAATVAPTVTTTVTTLDDEDDGTDSLSTSTDISLREAIKHSPADSLIIFDQALDGETIILANQLLIGKSLSIDASALSNGITIDANADASNRRRVFEIVNAVTVAMNNLTVTGGWTADGQGLTPAGGGGGILSNGSLTLNACTVRGNTAGNGAASPGPSTGGNGGGILSNGSLVLNSCVISDNTAGNSGLGGLGGNGGGISSDRNQLTLTSSLTLNACTVSGNDAGAGALGGAGGGIYIFGGSLEVTACTVNSNRAGDGFFRAGSGGGIHVIGGNPALTTCTISGNRTGNYTGEGTGSGGSVGGGISMGQVSEIVLRGCTVSSNVVSDGLGLGGGIGQTGEHSSLVDISNSIIAMNTSNGANVVIRGDLNEDGADDLEFDPSNFIDDRRILIGGELVAADGDPKLGSLGDNGGPTHTMAPLPDSPVIDNEKATYTHMLDQRGFAITDELPDIGAVENSADGDLTPIWDTDLDCDGHTFGVEFALGTDPMVSDPRHSANPQFSVNDSGAPVIDFGVNALAFERAVWILQRSSDLKTWTEVCRSDTPAFPMATFTETDPLVGSDAFYYRFKAEQKE